MSPLRYLFAFVALAQPVVAQTGALGEVVPAHDTFTIASRVLGEARLINVYTPRPYRTSPTVLFPVVYMPDGGLDEDFPHVVNTVDSLITLGVIRPVIVVGIPNTQRRRDLTGPTRVKSDSAIAPRVGGSAAFRRFIRDELVPAVRARYRTTDERSIVGESLAGLFIVETFLLEPTLFTHYVAFDPSLWWNRGALVDSAPAYLARFDASARSIFFAASKDDIDSLTSRFASLLRSATPRGVTWTYLPRPDQTHATIFRAEAPAGLARALK
jgi:predicted alpha/beta superfamily hydrolase